MRRAVVADDQQVARDLVAAVRHRADQGLEPVALGGSTAARSRSSGPSGTLRPSVWERRRLSNSGTPRRRARRATRKGNPVPPTAHPPGCRATSARSSAGLRLGHSQAPASAFARARQESEVDATRIRPYNAGHAFDPRRPLAPGRPCARHRRRALRRRGSRTGSRCPRRTPRTPSACATCTARCTTARTPITCAGATVGMRRSTSWPGCTTATTSTRCGRAAPTAAGGRARR